MRQTGDRAEISGRITDIFCQKLHIDVPAPDTDLVEAGILDSLMFVTLLLHLEEEFGTKITIEHLEIDDFCSIAKIADFVASTNGRMDG